MDFTTLTYNKLQAECKLRNLSAKGKTLELIDRLNEYEKSINTEEKNNNDDNNDDDSNTNKIGGFDFCNFDSFFHTDNDISDDTEVTIQSTSQSTSDNIKPVTSQNTSTACNNLIPDTNIKSIKISDLQWVFEDVGYKCLNDNKIYCGYDAAVILSQLYLQYPVIREYIGLDYSVNTRLSVQFGLSRELVSAKKVLQKGRNLIPDTVSYGDPKERIIKVQNDRGNDIGLSSEKRAPYRSGIQMGIINHKVVEKLFIGNKQIFPIGGSNITVLKSQSLSENTAKLGYGGKNHFVKNKISTGVKLTASVQKSVNTNLMSNLFKISEIKCPIQVEINKQGEIYLNQYMPSNKIRTLVGKISNLINGSYQIEYAIKYTLQSNKTINDKIQQLINKATNHDVSFLIDSERIKSDNTEAKKKAEFLKKQRQYANDLKHGRI